MTQIRGRHKYTHTRYIYFKKSLRSQGTPCDAFERRGVNCVTPNAIINIIILLLLLNNIIYISIAVKCRTLGLALG